MISRFWPDVPTTSPTALPIRSLATGDTKEIEPALGSASSSPTIRYFCTRPSSRLKVTVLPKATVSVDEGLVRARFILILNPPSAYAKAPAGLIAGLSTPTMAPAHFWLASAVQRFRARPFLRPSSALAEVQGVAS